MTKVKLTEAQAKELWNKCRLCVAIVATLFLILSVSLCFFRGHRHSKAEVLLVWALAPPVWFLCEYNFFVPFLGCTDVRMLKDLQDLSRNIWAGAGAVLAIIYFGGH